MAINFSCGQCGKDYAVRDGLAGKKAACKTCGNRMIIPGTPVAVEPSPPPKARPVASRPEAPPRPVERPASVSPRQAPIPVPKVAMRFADPGESEAPIARPSSKHDLPPGDVFGFDEPPSPLPPIAPRLGATGGEVSADASPLKKKKKKKGFFASSGKKSSSGGSNFLGGIGSTALKVGFIVFVAIGVIGALRLTSKSDVEAFTQRQVDMTNEMTSILRTVNSVPSAQSASPRLIAVVQRMIDNLEGAKDKKATKDVLNAVIRKMKPLQEAAQASLFREVQRIAAIPGAFQALQIEGPINRLAQLEAEAKASASRDGLDTN